MKNSKFKIVICSMWFIGVLCLFFIRTSPTIHAESDESKSSIPKPDSKEVEEFNLLIQKRFLTEPSFGITRISPNPPYSNHLYSFYSKNDLERKAVNNFEREGWRVGLYLYGKRAEKKVKNGVEQDKFEIRYHFNQPVIITNNIKKREDLSKNFSIINKVKEAFTVFQESETTEEKNFEFELGGWWYFAKPVRAVNQSCVQCHTDYVVAKKLDNKMYQFRKRKIGDVNGILVYAFQKAKK